jgi:hypothetical protein
LISTAPTSPPTPVETTTDAKGFPRPINAAKGFPPIFEASRGEAPHHLRRRTAALAVALIGDADLRCTSTLSAMSAWRAQQLQLQDFAAAQSSDGTSSTTTLLVAIHGSTEASIADCFAKMSSHPSLADMFAAHLSLHAQKTQATRIAATLRELVATRARTTASMGCFGTRGA